MKIKFKVWDKKEKRMSEPFEFAAVKSERFEFLQFTGEYDKNKTEIYEGDILNIKTEEELPSGARVCGSFEFRPKTQKTVEWETDGGWYLETNSLYRALLMNADYVVVGNIYEGEQNG
jgi:uncharacterized phage protein (TIGR01671 family)